MNTQAWVCPCGNENSDEHHYCTYCGAQKGSMKDPPPPPPKE